MEGVLNHNKGFQTHQILWPFGDDFSHQEAEKSYQLMD